MIKKIDQQWGEDLIQLTQWGGRKGLEALTYAAQLEKGTTPDERRNALLWLFDALKGHCHKVTLATDSQGNSHRTLALLDLDNYFAGRPAQIMPFVHWGLGANLGLFTEGDPTSPNGTTTPTTSEPPAT